MMKGLLYKDLILAKKHIILEYIYFLIIISVLVMLRLSLEFGNLAKMDIRDSLMNNMYIFRYLPPAMILIALASETMMPFTPDAVSGWDRFCCCAPVTKRQIINEKYAFAGLLLLLAYFSGLAYVLLFSLISGESVQINMLRNVTVLLLAGACYVYFGIPIQLILKNKKKRTIFITGIVIIVYGFIFSYFIGVIRELDGNEDIELLTYMRDTLAPSMNTALIAFAAAAALIICAGYILSDKLMKRGEEQ